MMEMENEDSIIVLDLEEGEIRSESDDTPLKRESAATTTVRRSRRVASKTSTPKKKKSPSIWDKEISYDEITLEGSDVGEDEDAPLKRKSSMKIPRSRRRQSKTATPTPKKKKSPWIWDKEMSLDEITLVGSDEGEDDDCKLVAIVAPANPTQAQAAAAARKAKWPRKSFGAHTPIGAGKLGFATRFEEIRRRSLLRRSSSKCLANQIAVVKRDPATVQFTSKKALKRLKKLGRGTPISVPPHQARRPVRYFPNQPQNHRGQNRRPFMGVRYEENEERTGKHRRRPLIPSGGQNVHNLYRNPQVSGFDLNTQRVNRVPLPPQFGAGQFQVLSQPLLPLGQPRPIIIDGSNVAIGHGVGKTFSSRGLEICVKRIKERLHGRHGKIVCFVPKFRAKKSESLDTQVLDRLESDGILKWTPSREVNGKHITSYDDRFILEYATTSGGIVITNDNYKDLFDEEPKWRDTIQNRLLQYTWVDDELMFPSDPLGKFGPTLERFCSFQFDSNQSQDANSNPRDIIQSGHNQN